MVRSLIKYHWVRRFHRPAYSYSEFNQLLLWLDHAELRLKLYNDYKYDDRVGKFVHTAYQGKLPPMPLINVTSYVGMNYGCGNNIVDGWLNADLYINTKQLPNYLKLNVTDQQPFADSSFQFAFAEDMVEHIDQPGSMIFLTEVYRVLKPGGVLRLSSPSLEGVLAKHCTPPGTAIFTGIVEAGTMWEHVHFFAEPELRIIAEQIGFTSINVVPFGESAYRRIAEA